MKNSLNRLSERMKKYLFVKKISWNVTYTNQEIFA